MNHDEFQRKYDRVSRDIDKARKFIGTIAIILFLIKAALIVTIIWALFKIVPFVLEQVDKI